MAKNKEKCQICLGGSSRLKNLSAESRNKVWSYFYHQNVREAVIPLTSTTDRMEVPRLTFTFSLGDGSLQNSHSSKSFKICDDCDYQLEELTNLHDQLEQIKKSIETKVRTINSSCRLRTNSDQETEEIPDVWKVPRMDTCLAGTTVGPDNISRTLRFLGSLCNSAVPPTSRQPAKNSKFSMETDEQDGNKEARTTRHVIKIFPNISQNSEEEASEEEDQEEEEATNQDLIPDQVIKMEPDDIFEQCGLIGMPESDPDSDSDDHIRDHDYDPLAEPMSPPSPHFSSGSQSRQEPVAAKRRRRFLPRKIPCTICGKLLVPQCMTAHLRTHTGEKPFKCEPCNKQFSQKGTLNKHNKKTHATVMGFSCQLCRKKFVSSAALKAHNDLKHKTDVNG